MADYVYMLACGDGSFYTGWTNDLDKRLKAHQSGKGAKYTRSHQPVRLVYFECFENKQKALVREAALKKLTHTEKASLITGFHMPEKRGGYRMKYGIQMYSVRDLAQNDLEGALKTVAEQGYELIEFAGFFDHSAEEVKGWLEKYGVAVSGTHSGADLLKDDLEGTIKFMKTIGNKNFIIPWADFSTREKADELIALINEVQPKLEAEGITLGYHNHAHEFAANEAGIVPYDELTKKTNIKFEIDTYWAFVAGKDPVALMEEYKDRLVFIHIKDGHQNGEGTPLGMGDAPIAAVYDKAKALGVPMVVESETLPPDGKTESDICIKWLKGYEQA